VACNVGCGIAGAAAFGAGAATAWDRAFTNKSWTQTLEDAGITGLSQGAGQAVKILAPKLSPMAMFSTTPANRQQAQVATAAFLVYRAISYRGPH
jgi:hypothetical protein